MSSSNLYKKEFAEVGELIEIEDGLAIRLRFGKPLKRILKHLYGVPLEVAFKPLKYQRTQAQNRWLWGVAYVTISAWYKETQGIRVSKEAIHAHTLQHILGYKVRTEVVEGREVIYMDGKSTSSLSTSEFNQMKTDLQLHWAEKGCDIPDPRENNFLSEFLQDD